MPRKLHSTDAPPEELPARGVAKRERIRHEEVLLELAGALVKLEPEDFERLDLPEEVVEEVATARACKLGKPRNRALRRVRTVLRDIDEEVVEETRKRLSDPV